MVVTAREFPRVPAQGLPWDQREQTARALPPHRCTRSERRGGPSHGEPNHRQPQPLPGGPRGAETEATSLLPHQSEPLQTGPQQAPHM